LPDEMNKAFHLIIAKVFIFLFHTNGRERISSRGTVLNSMKLDLIITKLQLNLAFCATPIPFLSK
jgi:hypothetical protein